jgi:hypothetical protein
MQIRASLLIGAALCAGTAAALAAAASEPAGANPSVAQIVDRYQSARGGLSAWRALQTLSLSGKLDAGTGDSVARSITMARQGEGASVKRAERVAAAEAARKKANEQVQLPFRLDMKRTRKSRLEIDFGGKTAIQVYDGEHGWKFRPYLNRDDVEPFTAEEAKWEATKADIEGPLMDYAAKGTQVVLEGKESVEGRDAYKLKLTLKNGDVQHVWIDAKSFLDVKVEGIPRRMDGNMRSVFVYQRDFRSVKGLMVPYELVTAIDGYPGTHRMVIESVSVNPTLEDGRFAKPQPLLAGTTPPAAPLGPAAARN